MTSPYLELPCRSEAEVHAMTDPKRLEIPEVSDVDMAFPADPPLPEWDDIPEEFHHGHTPFNKIASSLFFNGGKLSDFGLTPKEGVDITKAMRAIHCCLGSYRPKHEHKEAGVAFMFSEWFDLKEPAP